VVFRVSAVRRVVTAVVVFLIALSALLLAAAAQNSTLGSAVWLADHKHLKRIDLVTNEVDLTVSLDHEAEALAIDPADSGAWALAHKKLFKFDSNGQTVFQIDLKNLVENLDDPKHLVLNPYDTSLWVGGEKMLVHLDAQGQRLGAWKMSDEIQALKLDLDESLWLLTRKKLLHLSPQGAILHNLDLKSRIKKPGHLAVDSLGGLLWIAGKKKLIQLELNQPDQVPRSIPIPGGKSGREDDEDDDDDNKNGKILSLTTDPLLGTLWIVTKHSLLIYDRNSSLLKTVDLGPHNLGKVETLAFEPVSMSLWLGGMKALVRLTSNGDFVARIAVDKEVEAVGVAPFRLSPTLKMLEPENGNLTNNPRPPFRLGLGASCNELPCLLADAYTQSLSLDADLNGLAIGNIFALTATEASCLPPVRLPEGPNIFNARAKDIFGHLSNAVTGRFTIDTIAPTFLSLEPVDGTTAASSSVIIEGQVDDATASVILLDENGNSLSLGGANFSFAVTLKDGSNTFTLLARDSAGNATSRTLSLLYNPIPPLVDLAKIDLEIENGQVTVIGAAGSVQSNSTVTISNPWRETDDFIVTANPDGSFSATVVASLGDRLVITVSNSSGESSTPVNIGVMKIAITAPKSGITVYSGDSVSVQGTVLAPSYASVVVNDNPSFISGNAFSGTAWLNPGTNTITASVSASGVSASQSITVTLLPATSSPVQVTVNPLNGLAPLEVRFTAQTSGPSLQRLQIDYDSDGQIDYDSSAQGVPATNPVTEIYPDPGIYDATVTATDSMGNIHVSVHTITVGHAKDAMLRGIYENMIENLRNGNVEGAVAAFSGSMQEKYRAIFTALQPNLPAIVGQMGMLDSGLLGEDWAEYVLLRNENGESRAYLIYFMRGEDGVWRIEGM